MSDERAFLKAVRARPDDRTARLVYADWLQDRDDSRAELIRIEEEVSAAPIYADRYWELKPRRRALLASTESKWLKQMGYGGTDYRPVFADVPDGWKERWRLLREFAERWYQVPMPDVGGPLRPVPPRLIDWYRQTIDASMSDPKVSAGLPPSLREWMLFTRDLELAVPGFDSDPENRQILHDSGAGLEFFLQAGNRECCFIRNEHRHEPDPPVWWYHPALSRQPEDTQRCIAPRLTTLALDYLLTRHGMGFGEGPSQDKLTKTLARRLANCFPVCGRFDEAHLFERPNAIAYWTPGSHFASHRPCLQIVARSRKLFDQIGEALFP
ncbi:MAG: TIGR02996 domain-containing protein [Gemmataceae bacterium]|nr:TIGR02996 domain-containing protein [Gemmataceae bacterium]